MSYTVRRYFTALTTAIFSLGVLTFLMAAELSQPIADALRRAEDNRDQIQTALDKTPVAHRVSMEFLIAHMPDADLQKLSADYLLDNVRLAHKAWQESPWKDQIPESLFLNNVLPYANINENRDAWRSDFHERCKPLIKGAKTPAEAAVLLNQKLFPLLKVRYSTNRNRADQGPSESIRTGLASCTGLSILLIDACRSVGVPARFVGTPLWANKSGNHSWVEVWDQGWHFTGAAEPAGNDLDRAWFTGRAATAQTDHPLHAIYAVSYKKTPAHFPMVWAPSIESISAVNVTERYLKNQTPLPSGHVEVLLRVIDPTGERLSLPVKIRNGKGKVVFSGQTKDERFDANDHLSVPLAQNKQYEIEIQHAAQRMTKTILARQQNEPITLVIDTDGADNSAEATVNPASDACQPDHGCGPTTTSDSRDPVQSLTDFLAKSRAERGVLTAQSFATLPLTSADADRAAELLWEDHVSAIRSERKQEMEAKTIVQGDLKMPFFYRVFGDKPKNGRSLYISMHGGGGAPPRVNDQQWENQKRLYTVPEGVYAVPRAPTNTWNLWHQGHIDGMFARLIENLIVFEDVNPDRVYLMGYSAGGDGVFQVAPRMADRWAAAAMMAGHPNETSPLGLRNTAFTLHMGGKDSAYQRNKIAAQWKQKLADLRKQDPKGYEHKVVVYPNKGHWMDREDASAIPWMAEFERERYPARIVWKQDDVKHQRFYWLAAAPGDIVGRPLVIAERRGQHITIEQSDVNRLTVRLCDEMLDLDKPVQITWGNKELPSQTIERNIATLAKTLQERGEREGMFSAELEINLPSIQ
jgi:hypothetical protein